MGLKLQAEVGLNTTAFTRGMRGVASETMATVRNFALAYIGLRALESAFTATVQTAKDLTNESARMGVTVEQLQVMRKAASGAGVEIDRLAAGMEKLDAFRAKALKVGPEGNLARMQAAQLGITPAMFQSSSAQSILFGAIAQKVKSVDVQTIAAPLKEILGRGAGELVPLLKTDMAGLEKQMKSLGLVMSNETARSLKEVDTALNTVKIGFTNALAPVIVGLVKMFLGMLSSGGLLSNAFHNWAEWITGKINSTPDYTTKSGKVMTAETRAQAARYIMEQSNAELLKARKANPDGSPEEIEAIAFAAVKKMMDHPGMSSAMPWDSTQKAAFRNNKDAFDDFKGGTFKDLFSYLLGVQEPYKQSVGDSAKTADDLVASVKAGLDEMNKPASPDNPKAPGDYAAEAQQTKQRMTGQGDNLIAVGNFLGASRGVIGSAQARLEHHAAQTAANTQTMITLLDKIANNTSAAGGGFGDTTTNGTAFPP
jgi:hypothetical protein